jgi:hypothetical protein
VGRTSSSHAACQNYASFVPFHPHGKHAVIHRGDRIRTDCKQQAGTFGQDLGPYVAALVAVRVRLHDGLWDPACGRHFPDAGLEPRNEQNRVVFGPKDSAIDTCAIADRHHSAAVHRDALQLPAGIVGQPRPIRRK